MGSTPASPAKRKRQIAGWSSLVARQAHNLKVVGSNPAPATNSNLESRRGVAQPGSAFAWGAKGHEFKSRPSDQFASSRIASVKTSPKRSRALSAMKSEPNGDGKYGIMAAFKVEGNLDELHTHA